MKVLLFVDTDVAVRHFIHSGAFRDLAQCHDVLLILPNRHKRMGNLKPSEIVIDGARSIDLPECPSRLGIWRMRFLVEQLRGWPNTPLSHKNSFRRLFRHGNPLRAYLLYRLLGTPVIFQLFKNYMNWRLSLTPNLALNDLLEAEKPDVIVHPSVLAGIYIDDLVEAGSRRQIPTVVLMNSWDNPASKRSVVGTEYWLLVWGPQTRAHAEKIMGLPRERVIEFGAAQFDVYSEAPRYSREEILSVHGLASRTPKLLYAGSSKSTQEFEHLLRIDEAIRVGRLPNMQVIYRPHPWGDGGKGGERFLKHDFNHVVIDKNMRDYLVRVAHGDKSKSLPDYRDCRDLLSVVDAVVSPLSTILIEAMLMGKACVCYMPVEEEGADHFQLARHQIHFAELLDHPDVLVAWGADALLPSLAEIMRRAADPNYPDRLRRASEYFVRRFKAPFSQRLADFIEIVTRAH